MGDESGMDGVDCGGFRTLERGTDFLYFCMRGCPRAHGVTELVDGVLVALV